MQPYVTPETLKDKSKEWLKKIAPFNQHKMELNTEKAALLVVDMQDFFLDESSPTFTCGGLAIIQKLQGLITAFHGLVVGGDVP
jgi:isochorismate hydrolase